MSDLVPSDFSRSTATPRLTWAGRKTAGPPPFAGAPAPLPAASALGVSTKLELIAGTARTA